MAKIHITLVGGQITPIYQGIIHTNPDKIVYIYSTESTDIVKQLNSYVNISSEKRKVDPVNLNDIENKFMECAERYKNDDLTINISSGTKPWSYYLIQIFGDKKNATLFYIDQNANVWNFKTKESEKVQFDINAQFKLCGNELNDYKPLSYFTKEDINAIKEIESLRNFSPGDFTQLVQIFEKKNNITSAIIEKTGSYLKWDKEEKYFTMFLRKKDTSHKLVKLKSPHIRPLLINTGWFEYKVAELLSQWNQCKEIRVNCIFKAKSLNAKKTPKNEVDIIVDTGNKLLFVECKTQISKLNDIDKFNSVVKNYGGMGSKMLFVTDAIMSDINKEKCKEYKMLIFSFTEKNKNLKEELYKLLDKEILNINTK